MSSTATPFGQDAASASAGAALADLPAGFQAPARDSQRSFRLLLQAMSFPGRLVSLALPGFEHPRELAPAAAALLTALPDAQTRLWLSASLARQRLLLDYIRFHTGCETIDNERAERAELAWVGAADATDLVLSGFATGTDLQPHDGASLFIEVTQLAAHAVPDATVSMTLTGPGLPAPAALSVSGLPREFWQTRQAARAALPRGGDLVLTCGEQIVALPRTTELEVH